MTTARAGIRRPHAVTDSLESIRSGAALRDREVAELLSTTTQTLWRWKKAEAVPQPQSLQRLVDLLWIVQRLSAVYEPEDAKFWLYARHQLLGGDRPVDRIQEGRITDVLALVDQLHSGAYV